MYSTSMRHRIKLSFNTATIAVQELKAKILRALRLSNLIDGSTERGVDDGAENEEAEDDGNTDPSLLSQYSQERRIQLGKPVCTNKLME